ncbi:DUF2183 domain-containing protein [Corticibacter populi]|uniref:DUF2183 domain-containing protein n=1 Tax=Corticibacter populi TaxID=1550736 RepID=A0A3M6QY56_9BURK|nr:App1 family protein [Corticibacter populi]RMX07947.1 DUF2183 domain-containing protein [Corticibacter populi]RZS35187.1 uncharacterized protein DUF2183 [Corticibacter populi]
MLDFLPLRRRAALMAAGLGLWSWRGADASPLKRDEHVLPIPGLLCMDASGAAQADIAVWVYEDERRPGARSLFARYLGIDLDGLNGPQRALFETRARLFLKDSERGKRLTVVIDGAGSVALNPTDPAGRSTTRVTLPGTVWQGGAEPLRYAVVRPTAPSPADAATHRHGQGQLWPVAETGLSIVSDIDDTIKVSEVGNTRQLLRNTFLEAFQAVPGMAAWYRQMCSAAQQAVEPVGASAASVCCHYLSSSPLQLLPVLQRFIEEAGFPPGPLHLREATAWRSLLPGSADSESLKLGRLRQWLDDFPARRFVLIGDSGEADPEIYACIARQYPGQVAAIFIRDVTGEDAAAPRYAQVFEGVPRSRWHIIRDGHDGLAITEAGGLVTGLAP